MAKNPILDSDYSNDDDASGIRPKLLSDFIGQSSIKENLKVFIEASKFRNEPLDHVLFYGPPGLGKTTLSQIVANELGASIKFTSGPAITKSGDLLAILTNINKGDVVFIDEIHRINISIEEILYSAMEDFVVDIMLGDGIAARSVRIDLPKFTLIGATTRYGSLSNPLRDRFGIPIQMEFYQIEELQQIVKRSADIIKVEISADAAFEIARCARGTPRIANRLLRRIRDFMTIQQLSTIDKQLVSYALEKLEIDGAGLDNLDRKYISLIAHHYGGGPVGIDTIASLLSENKDTIEDVLEPYLIQKGFVIKTPRGRVLGKLAWDHLNLPPRSFDF